MFNSGDRIRVKQNGLTGLIVAISVHVQAHVTTEYVFNVMWDHSNNGGHDYTFNSMSEAEQMWELDGGKTVQNTRHAQNPFNQRPSQGIHFIPIEIKIGDVKVADCNHEWQDYTGLMTSYKFCKKCDVKNENN